jgi:hypothetical protein
MIGLICRSLRGSQSSSSTRSTSSRLVAASGSKCCTKRSGTGAGCATLMAFGADVPTRASKQFRIVVSLFDTNNEVRFCGSPAIWWSAGDQPLLDIYRNELVSVSRRLQLAVLWSYWEWFRVRGYSQGTLVVHFSRLATIRPSESQHLGSFIGVIRPCGCKYLYARSLTRRPSPAVREIHVPLHPSAAPDSSSDYAPSSATDPS